MSEPTATPIALKRELGLFDATMIVMGGIIGSGIFATPSTVAKAVHSPALVLAAWSFGGVIALVGAFIYAELAARRPDVGGQYAYLRDAYHPSVAFVYGWALLLVVQTGGMAAVSIIFASYFLQLVPLSLSPQIIAVIFVTLLVIINCLGVRAGSTVQNVLMVLKVAAIAALVCTGLFLTRADPAAAAQTAATLRVSSFGAAMTPVMFAFGGWQTASFISGEMRDPQRDLTRGLIYGVVGVIVLYLAVNLAFLHGLGQQGLESTATPATAVMRAAFGESGARFIAIGITLSTIGFLSQGMLTAPRVYYAMSRDKVFFESVGRLDTKTQVPVIAIILQGVATIVIALSGTFDQILSYVVSVDWIFFALTAGAIFVFRAHAPIAQNGTRGSFAVPFHPWSTVLFILAAAAIVVSTIIAMPVNSAIGIGIMLVGIPVFHLWRSRHA